MNINKYPYTDFHELNLDWFLAQFKTLTDAWDAQKVDYNKFKEDVTTEFNNLSGKFDTLEETVQSFTRFITNYFDNLDVQQEINNKLDKLVADGTMTELIRPIFDDYAAQTTQRMDLLEARMDEFASLPEGSTAGNAELVDIRIGGNGVTYSSAGNAVRAQYNINRNDINNLRSAFRNEQELWGKVYGEQDIVTNVLDIAEITDNKYMNPSNGTITDNTSYEIAKISLDNVDRLFTAYSNLTILNYSQISFFDENDNFISGYTPEVASAAEMETYNEHTGVFYVIPATAKSAVLSIAKTRIAIMYLVTIKENTNVIEVTIPLYKKKDNPFYGKTIVNFGDSIFGNFRDTDTTTDKSISKMIAEATGATVYNAGFGGCRMAYHSTPWRAFSMYALADSIANNDWTEQDNALSNPSLPAYFAITVAMLKTIDFSTVDYITIGYGTNDYSGDIFIKSTDATFDHEYQYFEGALKYSLRTILNAYPNLKIIVISPCWRWFPDADGAYSYDSDDEQSRNTRNYKLTDYVDACKKVCEEYHVPYIDTYYTLGFNPYSYKAYFPVKDYEGSSYSDGTHPNQNGRQLRADRIIGQMESLY